MSYAEGTAVTPERSQMEIAALIRKYEATSFATGWQDARSGKEAFAMVTFNAHERQIRFVLPIPSDPKEYMRTPAGRSRTLAEAKKAMDGEVRRRWRALALAIKAKLEVVESGIATFEVEFMGHIVLPDGSTVADRVIPEVAEAYRTGGMPRSMLAIEAAS